MIIKSNYVNMKEKNNLPTDKYIAITLGPITRVLKLADSTKALWAASYIFSHLAKRVIAPFVEREFLLPQVDKIKMWQSHRGAGLFPDRYIFKSTKDDFDFLVKHVKIVISDLSKDISGLISPEPNPRELEDFLNSCFKIYFLEREFYTTDKKEIVSKMEKSLTLLEMQDTFPVQEETNYLQQFFRNVNGSAGEGSFLTKDAFGEQSTRLFKSIFEISAAELDRDNLKKIVREMNKKKPDLSRFEEVLKPYHKYICIVNADGDSIGKTLEKLDNHLLLSEALLDFNIQAAKKIAEHKGAPVFIGGDDLLFFAPLCCHGQTIFHLVQEIDEIFKSCLSSQMPNLGDEDLPTLSYGVSVSYYKFPLFEALSKANNLLFDVAKNNQLDGKTKNNLALSMLKHSGQTYETIIRKSLQRSYHSLLKDENSLLNNWLHRIQPEEKNLSETPEAEKAEELRKKDARFLSSIMHWLVQYEPMLKLAFESDLHVVYNPSCLKKEELIARLGNPDSISNLFENCFNEGVHKEQNTFIEQIKHTLIDLWTDYQLVLGPCFKRRGEELSGELVSDTVTVLYTILQFIHFINLKTDE